MLFVFTLIALAVVLIIFAIGVVLAIIIAACCLILVSLGIISAAALTGILRRKLSSGLRALHYQVCAVVALPAGIGFFWGGLWLFSSDMPLPAIIIIGSASGICAGLVIAFVLDHAAGLAYQYLSKLKTSSTENNISNPPTKAENKVGFSHRSSGL